MLRLGRAITGIESAKKSDTARKNAKKKIGMRINMTATTVKRVGTGKPLKVIDRGDCARQRRHRGHTGQQFPQAGSDEKTRSLLEY